MHDWFDGSLNSDLCPSVPAHYHLFSEPSENREVSLQSLCLHSVGKQGGMCLLHLVQNQTSRFTFLNICFYA